MPAQTLGRTLLVRDLSTARRLAPEAPGFRFLTLQGELLEADGALTVGTQKVEAGFLARKSELASLQDQVTRLDFEVDAAQQRLSQARTELDDDARWLEDKQQEIDVLAEQAADFRARVTQYRDRRQGLHDEVTLQRDELQKLDQEAQTLEASWRQAHNDAALAEQKVQELHVKLHKAEETLHQLDQERQKKAQAFTAAQISQAKVEERRAGVQSRHEQQERDLRQRQAELAAGEQALVSCHQRSTECQMTMLSASAALAHLHLDKEARQAEIARRIHERDTRRQDRGRLAQQAQTVRAEWRTQQDAYHQRELAANDLRHERQTLVDRIKEDYQIDLNEDAVNRDPQGSVDAELPETKTPDLEDASADSALRGLTPPGSPQIDPAAAQEEIEELRRKLSRLGNVNLAALDELQELEGRAASLRTQYDDLISAKKSLEEIIGKINVDSRKLFQDTFVVIRGHFQELFRKLFGGGMADVVLEDEADVLESGIEIIARPPGKELRSISLMSGGEKTLTAVALLLAIFRSKPSPFCLLDEVDAALDEANIGRFTAVLRDFLDLSQFIIVTHSKKTMAVADVLYGITMQESGISKQVAVRFEDWVDENAQPTAQTA
ncbi:MAG: AAA family ATPase [Gemmataceae bacterium]